MSVGRSLLVVTALLAAALVCFAAALIWMAGLAAAEARSQTKPVRHVIVIDLENHSFDNVLGYWCDDNPGRCPDGGMPTSVKLSNGAVVTPSVSPDTVPHVSHSVNSQLAAMHIQGGVPRMDGWENIRHGGCAASTNYQCVSGYQPGQIPNITALATQFAISDRTFSMGDSPSWGGHLYAAMASLDGFTGDNPYPAPGVTTGPGWGCDSDRVGSWLSPSGALERIPSCIPDYSLGLANGGAFEPTPAAYEPTIFDELHNAGLSWKIYGAASPGAVGYDWSICPSIAECEYTTQRKRLVDASRFVANATKGALPALAVVTAGGASQSAAAGSCHNDLSMTACDNYIGQLVSAVEAGPEWSSSAIFITFDDFGGFYDQLAPSRNPDNTLQGPRLPLVIVSPYARARYTDTTSTTYAGVLAYVEHNFGLSALSINDLDAYDFSDAFDYTQSPLRPAHLSQRPLPASARHISAASVANDTS